MARKMIEIFQYRMTGELSLITHLGLFSFLFFATGNGS